MLIITAAIGLPLLGRGLLGGLSFQPALVLQGTAEAAGGWTDYTVLLHIVTAGLLTYWAYRVKQWPLVIWTIVLVAAALWQRRFDYYLIVPLSLLLGGATGTLHEHILSMLSYIEEENQGTVKCLY